MDKLEIKKITFQKLADFCSSDLLNLVLSNFGVEKTIIDDNNMTDNIWNITDFVNTTNPKLIDKLKVILTFYQLGGSIIYKGNKVPYEILFRLLGKTECNDVLLFWEHNKANDLTPSFDIGELIIPEIMQRYVCTKITESLFVVEKWDKGKYTQTNYIYQTEELCKAKVKELILEYEGSKL